MVKQWRLWIMVWGFVAPAAWAQSNSVDNRVDLPADVRLVIDVSGSMKRNDPNNLRQPAVDLLVQLLPEDSKGGVWTFGQWVNMLIPHKPVNESWRQNALEQADKINSVGLFTNIGEALERAAYDVNNPSTTHRTSIILLTDGMVDIDKDPASNRREWRRIADEVLPRLEQADITVHTIALSENADNDLMNKLALATGGIAEVAKSADDLMRIFLKAFDVAAPAEQVPFEGNSFVIDSSVEEFTALIFRDQQSEPTRLIGPDEETYSASARSKFVSWYDGGNYDLVTIKQPLEGEWQVAAQMRPDSRITVVSNLNLRVSPLPNNAFINDRFDVTYFLQEDGHIIDRSDFLSLMEISLDVQAGNDEFDLRELWNQDIDTQNPPAGGRFNELLPVFDRTGIYQLTINVDGKSFKREFSHQFNVREPFGAEVNQTFENGRIQFLLKAHSYSNNVNFQSTQVVATVTGPDGGNRIQPLTATGLDGWEANLLPQNEGKYIAKVKIRGETRSGEAINVELNDIVFNYSIEGGFVEEEAPFFEPTPQATAEPKTEVTPAPEEELAPEPEEDVKDGLPDWVLYAILGAGNLVIFGLGFFVFKKLFSNKKSEDILDEFSDEAINEEPEVPAETLDSEEPEAQQDDFDEEPPMEDLEPAMDDSIALDEPIEDETPDVFDEPEQAPEDDTFSLTESEMFEEDAPAVDEPDTDDIAVESSSVADEGFDDLDEMAMTEEKEKAIEDELDKEDDDDDMVAAMLKAQGLDLAEDELDEAISSLIDDLDRDDVDLDEYQEPDDRNN